MKDLVIRVFKRVTVSQLKKPTTVIIIVVAAAAYYFKEDAQDWRNKYAVLEASKPQVEYVEKRVEVKGPTKIVEKVVIRYHEGPTKERVEERVIQTDPDVIYIDRLDRVTPVNIAKACAGWTAGMNVSRETMGMDIGYDWGQWRLYAGPSFGEGKRKAYAGLQFRF